MTRENEMSRRKPKRPTNQNARRISKAPTGYAWVPVDPKNPNGPVHFVKVEQNNGEVA
jgi:hypothetical protein